MSDEKELSFEDLPVPKLLKSEHRLKECLEKLLDPEMDMFFYEREDLSQVLCYLLDERENKDNVFEAMYSTCLEYGFAIKDTHSKKQAKKILPDWLVEEVYENQELIDSIENSKVANG